MLKWFALWTTIPLLIRIWVLGNGPLEGSILLAFLLGFLEDLFVSCQVILFLSALSRGFSNRIRVLLGVIFLGVHSFYALDLLLHSHTGLRMTSSFFYFFTEAPLLVGSAMQLGLPLLLVSVSAFLSFSVVLIIYVPRILPPLQLSRKLGVLSTILFVGTLLSTYFMPATQRYAWHNAIIQDEKKALANLWSKHVSVEGPTGAIDPMAIALLSPQGERYQRVRADFPLLKRTDRFEGEKTFQLEMTSGEKPHVIFLFLESFRAKDIGALGGEHKVTPHFDRLAKKGILFTNFYSGGVQTTRAVMASLYGVYPDFTARPVQSRQPDLPLIGIPDFFLEQGYHTAFFHNGSLHFERKDLFFPRHGFEAIYGRAEVAAAFPKAASASWGVHDEYLMSYFVKWLQAQDARMQSTFSTLFTVSHHHPWDVPDDYTAPAFDFPDRPEFSKFLQSMHYSDHALGCLVRLLERQGLDRKTILFVLADTAQPMGEHRGNNMLVNGLFEENLRIPLLIYAPGHTQKEQRVSGLGGQVDLMATVMDLFDITSLNHSVGSSLLRKLQDRKLFFNNPFGEELLGLRSETHKYIYNLTREKHFLYDLNDDPGEQHNLAPGHLELVEGYQSQALRVVTQMSDLYSARRIAPPQ